MAVKKMIVRIGRDGATTIRVEGGEGDDCLLFTRSVEQALGVVQQREFTADYHEHDPLAVIERDGLKTREDL
ncbi:MAG: DUF2997 domain-containing protein [Nitrosomonadales bacterium]|nr:DUF2997 domain-containing protein [Nitrosomonadales bacterium]